MSTVTILVLAKAPVPGAVKTRLAADLGGGSDADLLAAELAAAALLDTLASCRATGAGCRIALAGDLARAVRRDDLRDALRGWTVAGQHGATFGERLVAAHAEVPGPVVQVGMDTPHAGPGLLLDLAAGLTATDAVLAPAADGGWWALALRSGRLAAPLAGVPMSRPTTYRDTRRALVAAGLSVGAAPRLTDVDHLQDARAVATEAPTTAFARAADALLGSTAR
jgi:glycosyltransferase A (GT-A) superfamily protein (DUF2064 family)